MQRNLLRASVLSLMVLGAGYAAVATTSDGADAAALTLIPGVLYLENNHVRDLVNGGCVGTATVTYLPLLLENYEIETAVNADCSATATFYEVVTLAEGSGGASGPRQVVARRVDHEVWVGVTGCWDGRDAWHCAESGHNAGPHHGASTCAQWGSGTYASHRDCFTGSPNHDLTARVRFDGATSCTVDGRSSCNVGGQSSGGRACSGGSSSCRNGRGSTSAQSGQTGWVVVEN